MVCREEEDGANDSRITHEPKQLYSEPIDVIRIVAVICHSHAIQSKNMICPRMKADEEDLQVSCQSRSSQATLYVWADTSCCWWRGARNVLAGWQQDCSSLWWAKECKVAVDAERM